MPEHSPEPMADAPGAEPEATYAMPPVAPAPWSPESTAAIGRPQPGPRHGGTDPAEANTEIVPVVPAWEPPHDGRADGDDLLDEGWDDPPRRTPRLTVLLVGGIVAALAFGGGVLAQKSHDTTLVGGASRARAAFATGGGAGAQRGAAGQAGSASTGAGAGGTAQGGSDTAPVVVGTVSAVSGSTLTVTDFGGTAVTVTVPPTATVTTSGLTGLRSGDPVSVAGTEAADGTVTATAVTSHKT